MKEADLTVVQVVHSVSFLTPVPPQCTNKMASLEWIRDFQTTRAGEVTQTLEIPCFQQVHQLFEVGSRGSQTESSSTGRPPSLETRVSRLQVAARCAGGSGHVAKGRIEEGPRGADESTLER